MRQNILIVIFISTLFSCTKLEDTVIRNHKILNVILNDRLPLANQNISISGTNNRIQVKDIILIADSKCDIVFDSKRNNLRMFNSISPNIEHPFYGDSVEYILEQLSELSSYSWDAKLIYRILELKSPKRNLKKELTIKRSYGSLNTRKLIVIL